MTGQDWQGANHRCLMAHLRRVHAAIGQVPQDAWTADEIEALEREAAEAGMPLALARLVTIFRLTPFERDILLMCAGPELEGSFNDTPTFALAFARLADAHWSATVPAAPLRRWCLINVPEDLAGEPLMRRRLSIDERALHYLTGTNYIDEKLAGALRPAVSHPADLAGSQQRVVGRLADALSTHPPAVIQLHGSSMEVLERAAVLACTSAGLAPFVMDAADVPAAPSIRLELARRWDRESLLSGAGLILRLEGADAIRPATAFCDALSGPVIILRTASERLSLRRTTTAFEIQPPAPEEQRTSWQRELANSAPEVRDGFVPLLITHFNLEERSIRQISARALAMASSPSELQRELWDACRSEARRALDEYATRIDSRVTWSDLILPDAQHETLHEIVAHVRCRHTVYNEWGFAAKSSRGLGTSVVFAGPSGTGKTLAAEVLGNELSLDLYRIDLSSVVSKYIGETEKNLRRIFRSAEQGSAILLFDEADALFGKRSEVKDSHDRYANVEVSFLLQQMEAYRGVAILTTNMLDAFDPAFLRRIRFVVQFPFPGVPERTEIWRRAFPPGAPLDHVDPAKLARMNVTGGNIRSMAMNAAFLAADAGEPICMHHVLRAARTEFAKLEKPLNEADIGDWVRG